ncbi:PRTRC system protein E [Burkholderia vietnamiensis]|uniref:PRTRC system protein E n=1 Tax=Burkholderia vietnamiensis TaxID=60552 RepID=UPI001CF4146B|nr:PRTRC system protein E [Burkholderia vietnamiensis]MCA8229258.1 PRTRC system protein E [Burkholderia vietnamiensis]
MSLFTSLHELARTTSINILITAEGDDHLRVNVTPLPNGKGEKKLWPLSLVATPEELDAEFAAAVEAYEPGALSLLDQARACAAANTSGSAPALPAPSAGQSSSAPAKRGRGRPPKAAKAGDADASPSNNETNENATDPRQMRIDDAQQSAGAEPPAAAPQATAEPASAPQPQAGDEAVDMY